MEDLDKIILKLLADGVEVGVGVAVLPVVSKYTVYAPLYFW